MLHELISPFLSLIMTSIKAYFKIDINLPEELSLENMFFSSEIKIPNKYDLLPESYYPKKMKFEDIVIKVKFDFNNTSSTDITSFKLNISDADDNNIIDFDLLSQDEKIVPKREDNFDFNIKAKSLNYFYLLIYFPDDVPNKIIVTMQLPEKNWLTKGTYILAERTYDMGELIKQKKDEGIKRHQEKRNKELANLLMNDPDIRALYNETLPEGEEKI